MLFTKENKMKNNKILIAIIAMAVMPCLLLFGKASVPAGKKTAIAATTDSSKPYRSVYMAEYDSDVVLLAENAEEKRPIASMVKIMTLLLTFEEIDAGRLAADEKVTVSDYAASMGGSQLFLTAGSEYPVCDLIKGVTVCSANDAAVALSEKISGCTDSFVDKMNEKAALLGMTNTLFCNPTGLPSEKEQYSTARDVTVMMKSLLSHKQYFDYSKIWMENYVHPDGRTTQIVNTNKLIRTSPYCDAGKTGFTNEAMFCVSASGVSGDMRVICTVLGFNDGKARFSKVNEWFGYAFGNYQNKIVVREHEPIDCNLEVKNAKTALTKVYCDTELKYFSEKNKKDSCSVRIDFNENLAAPIAKDAVVGKITLVDENGEISSGLLRADCAVEKASFFDRFRTVIENRTVGKK